MFFILLSLFFFKILSYTVNSSETDFTYSSKLTYTYEFSCWLIFFWNKYSDSWYSEERKYSVWDWVSGSAISSLILVTYSYYIWIYPSCWFLYKFIFYNLYPYWMESFKQNYIDLYSPDASFEQWKWFSKRRCLPVHLSS